MAEAAPDMSVSKFGVPAPDAGTEGVGDATFGVDEKKLVAKLDRHLVPLVMLLYTFSFLDRYQPHAPYYTPVFT